MSFCRWTIPINQHGSHSTYGLLRQCAFACHTPGKVGNQKILGFSLNEQNGNCACKLENSADCTRDTSKSSTIKRYDFREGTLVSNKRLRNEVPTKFINHKPVLDLKLVPRTNGWTRRSQTCTHVQQGGFFKIVSVSSSSDCRKKCEKHSTCRGVSYKIKSRRCFLFAQQCLIGMEKSGNTECPKSYDWCNYDYTPSDSVATKNMWYVYVIFVYIYIYVCSLIRHQTRLVLLYIPSHSNFYSSYSYIITSFFISSVSLQARENCGNTKLRVW